MIGLLRSAYVVKCVGSRLLDLWCMRWIYSEKANVGKAEFQKDVTSVERDRILKS